ncbi:cupin domain-containing protein [Winogradskya consettensis]|uniref:MerR family transcriptional regulator n=2 Tax=Winogradskya TaxID=3240235 RepID=A0A919SSA3_9ACTN|nr:MULTISPECIES: XRE family transcriptional regulator [Actinoplanes]GIE23184.1 MerR family transcriptional regulator [Actinoplanes humidus]GIM76547.1 MerR family transcriptional regulator [Actinoplanes consettensis]
MTTPENLTTDTAGFERKLGTYIRELRLERKVSLRSLAAESGVSVSFLSQVERGEASPSIATLMKIAKALGQTISSMFESPAANSRLVRSGQGPRLVHPHGDWAEELLTPRAFTKLQVIRSTLAPRGTTGEGMLSYGTSETAIFVESGRVDFWLGAERFDLRQGDCLSYDPSAPHRLENPTDEPVVLLFSSAPPSY